MVLFASDRERVNRLLKAKRAAPSAWTTASRCASGSRSGGSRRGARSACACVAHRPHLHPRPPRRGPRTALRRLAADGLLRAQRRLPFPHRAAAGRPRHQPRKRRPRRRPARRSTASGLGFRLVECDAGCRDPTPRSSLVGRARRGARPPASTSSASCGAAAPAPISRPSTARPSPGPWPRSTVPVLTGIGHEIDTSVADEVAWRAPRHAHRVRRVPRRAGPAVLRRDATRRCCAACGPRAPPPAAPAITSSERPAASAAPPGAHLRDAERHVAAVGAAVARRPCAALDAAGAALGHRAARVRRPRPRAAAGPGLVDHPRRRRPARQDPRRRRRRRARAHHHRRRRPRLPGRGR